MKESNKMTNYPKLMMSKTNSIIVLMQCERLGLGSGTVVKSQSEPDPLGVYRADYWDIDNFETLSPKSEVVLKNEA